MSDHLRRIYDLERQLPERNFAKDHSYEEWLVQQGGIAANCIVEKIREPWEEVACPKCGGTKPTCCSCPQEVKPGSTSIEGCPHTEIELQKVCERCGYREPVGDAPDQLARTAAEKLIDEFKSCWLVPDGYTHETFYGKRMSDIIESVLRP